MARLIFTAFLGLLCTAIAQHGGGDFPTLGGWGNNLQRPAWGAAEQPLLRRTNSAYDDGLQVPRGGGWSPDIATLLQSDLPSPREISNAVIDQAQDALDERGLTSIWWQWGQFLDHDIDLTTESQETVEHFNIPIPMNDPEFQGTTEIEFARSNWDKSSASGRRRPREQRNAITSFIDASNVYGSDTTRADALREAGTAYLKTSTTGTQTHLPFNTIVGVNIALPSTTVTDAVAAGDFRVNEQAMLTAMHDLWVREHNRLVDWLQLHAPHCLSPEQLYQEARKIVIAQMQIITYQEWLPALLGDQHELPRYRGYQDDVNPSILNEFSTVAFRLGHSLIRNEYLMVDEDATGGYQAGVKFNMTQLFFNPSLIHAPGAGTNSILRGLVGTRASRVDTKVVNALRNELFNAPLDLPSLNIQRGRDHGMPSYNDMREGFGLRRKPNFGAITDDNRLAHALEQVYGHVDRVDAWVGGLAEDHVRDGSVGELFAEILSDQFGRLRDGDRFFWDTWLSRAEKNREIDDNRVTVQETTLASVMRRNGVLTGRLPRNVFFCRENPLNRIVTDATADERCPQQSP